MATVTAAGALGLFGDGWLSGAEAAAGDELTVAYPRFARAQAPLQMTVDWRAGSPESTLWIARSFLDDFAIAEIRPAPVTTTAGADRTFYTFRTLEGEGRARVGFTLEPQHPGAVRGRIGSAEGVEVEVRQFVFP